MITAAIALRHIAVHTAVWPSSAPLRLFLVFPPQVALDLNSFLCQGRTALFVAARSQYERRSSQLTIGKSLSALKGNVL
jgi:hypothetical protein